MQAIKSVLALRNITDEELARTIFTRFSVLLEEAYDSEPVREQPGATDLFHFLRDHQVLVVLNTGYDRRTAETLIDKLNWRQGFDFDALITASDVSEGRPAPDMIRKAMFDLGLTDPQQVMKVGDSIIDIEEGQNAGCALSIGITTGAHTREQLKSAKPDSIVSELMELMPIISQAAVANGML